MSQLDHPLLTVSEAADVLGASRASVKRWAADGTLAFQQKLPGPTGAYLFHRSDVEALRDARQATAEVAS